MPATCTNINISTPLTMMDGSVRYLSISFFPSIWTNRKSANTFHTSTAISTRPAASPHPSIPTHLQPHIPEDGGSVSKAPAASSWLNACRSFPQHQSVIHIDGKHTHPLVPRLRSLGKTQADDPSSPSSSLIFSPTALASSSLPSQQKPENNTRKYFFSLQMPASYTGLCI